MLESSDHDKSQAMSDIETNMSISINPSSLKVENNVSDLAQASPSPVVPYIMENNSTSQIVMKYHDYKTNFNGDASRSSYLPKRISAALMNSSFPLPCQHHKVSLLATTDNNNNNNTIVNSHMDISQRGRGSNAIPHIEMDHSIASMISHSTNAAITESSAMVTPSPDLSSSIPFHSNNMSVASLHSQARVSHSSRSILYNLTKNTKEPCSHTSTGAGATTATVSYKLPMQ